MRGDKRVAVRFNLVARKASDEATHEDYVEKFEASDNLKWSLSGETVGREPAAARQDGRRRAAPPALACSTGAALILRSAGAACGASASSTRSRIRSSRPSIAR